MNFHTLRAGDTARARVFGSDTWTDVTYLGDDRWRIADGAIVNNGAITKVYPVAQHAMRNSKPWNAPSS
jgi:hypothetical protein